MRYGVIDLGSNTIRTVVYETEGKSFKKLISERSFTGILNYIENGRLRPDGIEAIRETVSRMAELCRLLVCAEIHAFARHRCAGYKTPERSAKRSRTQGFPFVSSPVRRKLPAISPG